MPPNSRVLGVGIATLDIINTVATHTSEDDEVRALTQRKTRGGNATNTLVVLSALGHRCDWAGVLAEESDTLFIKQDLDHHQVSYKHCKSLLGGKMPTSYVRLAQDTGSRSIVHYRDLPEYDFASYKMLTLENYDWIHFEGRNIDDTLLMMQYTKNTHPSLPLSLEIEKPRDNIESLFPYATVLLFSKPYALAQGFKHARPFLEQLATTHSNATLICAWGEQGAYAINNKEEFFYSPSYPPPQVLDTLGAGDTFNAGIIDSLLKARPIDAALSAACRLAGEKCGHTGLIRENHHDHNI